MNLVFALFHVLRVNRLSVTSVVYLVVQSVVLVEFMKICTSFEVLCFVHLELSSFYVMLWTDSYEYVPGTKQYQLDFQKSFSSIRIQYFSLIAFVCLC